MTNPLSASLEPPEAFLSEGSEELTALMEVDRAPFARTALLAEMADLGAALETSQKLPAWVVERAPYLAGAKEYADLVGTKHQEAQRTRAALYLSLVANLVLTMAVAALAWMLISAPRALPYVVSLDASGYVVPIKPADAASKADERVVIASLARWVRALRTVVGDKDAQRALVTDVYAMLAQNSEASRKTRAWLTDNSPYDAHGRRVDVDIVRIAPMGSPYVYSVDWVERERSASSALAREARYSALITIKLSPLQRLDELIKNPLGVFVAEYAISKIQ